MSASTPIVRDDFPLLERRIDGRPIRYLDSAATSLKPRQVMAAEHAYATRFTANVHRGKHALSEEASAAFDAARRCVARFVGADPDCVVFTRNATEALNLVAAGLGLETNDVVLVASVGEHHANIVPWMRRAQVRLAGDEPLCPASLDEARRLLRMHRPKVLAVGFVSNVTGVVQPVPELCALAREFGALSVVDAAQAAPHLPLDVASLGCDLLAFSGHKTLGPTGVGVLTGRREVLEMLDPLVLGGGAVERVTTAGFTLKQLPERLEAGTPAIGSVLGLAAALEYLMAIGFDVIAAYEQTLADSLHRALTGVPGIRVLMAAQPRIAIAAFAVQSPSISADDVARRLSDGDQIMVRSGFHCAHPLFDALGLPGGAVRVSAYLYNTVAEIEHFGVALRRIAERMFVA